MDLREPRAGSKKTDQGGKYEGAETEVGVWEKQNLYYIYLCIIVCEYSEINHFPSPQVELYEYHSELIRFMVCST